MVKIRKLVVFKISMLNHSLRPNSRKYENGGGIAKKSILKSFGQKRSTSILKKLEEVFSLQ